MLLAPNITWTGQPSPFEIRFGLKRGVVAETLEHELVVSIDHLGLTLRAVRDDLRTPEQHFAAASAEYASIRDAYDAGRALGIVGIGASASRALPLMPYGNRSYHYATPAPRPGLPQRTDWTFVPSMQDPSTPLAVRQLSEGVLALARRNADAVVRDAAEHLSRSLRIR